MSVRKILSQTILIFANRLSLFTLRKISSTSSKKHGIEFYEKKLGQLFCRESSRQIVGMLLKECEDADVKILTDCSVAKLTKNKGFKLETNKGTFTSENLVIATGGLSFPKIGATDFGYEIAKQFGIKMTKLRPSLVPLVFANGKNFSKLVRALQSIPSPSLKNKLSAKTYFLHTEGFPVRQFCRSQITGKKKRQ